MINHIRTLLLNRPANSTANIPDGEEFIDPSFVPLKLDGALFQLHELFIREAESRDKANFRAACIMQILHLPDFDTYLKRFDDRITYDVRDIYWMTERAAERKVGYNFDGQRLYDELQTALSGPMLTRLFKPISGLEGDLEKFRQIWFTGDNLYLKLAAAAFAVVYQMNQEFNNAITV